MLLALVVAGGLGGLASFGEGCTSTTCEDTSTCSSSGSDGSTDGLPSDHVVTPDVRHDGHRDGSVDGPTSDAADGGDGGPKPCDGMGTPAKSPCVISDAFGVFVAPVANGGSDSAGDGTRGHPYATLTFAIPKAVAASKRVYACSATYAEAVTIGTTADGVEIYGGLVCPAAGDGGVLDAGVVDSSTGPWSYNGAKGAVAPTSTGLALDVESLTMGAHFEDMSFTAMPANPSNPGESSIAVMVNGSGSVSFRGVLAKAGDGSMGAVGSALSTNMCATSLLGSAATGLGGGNPSACTCPVSGSSAGGAGGGGSGAAGSPGFDGGATPGTSLTVPFYDGKGGQGAIVAVQLCGNGDNGANASAQAGGASGAAGMLKAGAWQPAIAGSGMPGDPGQGGGGGGGSLTVGGAGGGAGGCGGNGGGGGGGGGASLAMAIVKSTVTVSAVTVQSGVGGQGGAGAKGEQGQAGGTGGFGASQCPAGNGGQGAGGSGGGGGAGGPSVGIGLGSSSTIKIDGTTITPPVGTLSGPSSYIAGGAGLPGSGGAAGAVAPGGGGNTGQSGNAGNVGPSGMQGAVQAL